MKFTEVTIEHLKQYARVEHDEEDSIFDIILAGARNHIRAFTGLEDEKLDTLADVVIALMVISNEMYENRIASETSTRNSKFNELLDRILGSHSINLL